MTRLTSALACLTVLAALLVSGHAHCEERARKPVVCAKFEVLRPDAAVCSDGKRPFLLTQFSRFAMPVDGKATTYLVGFR